MPLAANAECMGLDLRAHLQAELRVFARRVGYLQEYMLVCKKWVHP